MKDDIDETERSLVDIIALALEPYDIPTGRSWAAAERVEPAEKVLAALGIELVGWCDDAEWSDTTKTVGRLWYKTKPRLDAIPVYRLTGVDLCGYGQEP